MYRNPFAQRSSNRALASLAALLIALAFLPVAPAREAAAAASASVEFDDNIQRVSSNGVRSIFPWSAIDANGNAHVAYYEQNNDRMMYSHNANGSWSNPAVVATGTGYAEPYLSHRSGILHLSYGRGNNIYYRRGTLSNNGASVSWGTPELIASNGKNFGGANWPDANGNVHFTWISNSCGQYNVYYRFRTANGQLSNVEAPRQECGTFQTSPRITVTDDGRAHIAFQRDGRGEIYHARRSTNGSWSSRNISNSPSWNSSNPSIAGAGNAVYASWGEGIASGNHDIYFARSQDGGDNWSNAVVISGGPEFAQEPSVAYSPGSRRIYVTWQDELGGGKGQPEVWFMEFDPLANNGSGEFGVADRVITRARESTLPIIAAGLNKFIITWQDKNTGDWEVLRNGGTIKAVGCEVDILTLNGGTPQTKNTTFGATAKARDCNPTRYQVAVDSQDTNQPTATWTAGAAGTQGFNVTIPNNLVGRCTHTVYVRLFSSINNQEIAGEWASADRKSVV